MKNNMANKRVDGLMIINVDKGNPNGDPDAMGAPRQMGDGRGMIFDKSIKRKTRDIFEDHGNPVFEEIAKKCGVSSSNYGCYDILESFSRGFDTNDPLEAKELVRKLLQSQNGNEKACAKYVDVRWYGTTFLDEQGEKGKKIRFKKSGVIQICPAVSLAPITLILGCLTRKANTEDEKVSGGGMAPDGLKIVDHGLYIATFSINPFFAKYTGTTETDIELFKNTIPYAFSLTSSTARPAGSVEFIHIWWAEHDNVLGSFNASELFAKLMPFKKSEPDVPSTSIDEYEIPTYIGNNKVIDLVK